ncbi:hypothetical protein [Agitococcus lubricus]|uniref:Uncharacterized protein n=1 Tax=Agitococcus lubricus TaxID=1077255 RepID=A0A2T5IRY0_9GAMM|nr:hypothetical protein [Agitococcus lubricus]PTQ86568.1 hypothetical protein C8N29_1375 [Agitococcus lubricus]
MNTSRLYFLRQFANTVQNALTTSANTTQNEVLATMLSTLHHAKNIGNSVTELSQLTQNTFVAEMSQIPPQTHDIQSTSVRLEDNEANALTETQPIIWQDNHESHASPVDTISSVSAVLSAAKQATEHTHKSVWQQAITINSTQTAASFFPSLPWLTQEVSSASDLVSPTSSHAFSFTDPWDTQTAHSFFQGISWTTPTKNISISAAHGAPSAVIQPDIIQQQYEQGLHPVLDFFGALPWKGSVH